MSRGKRADRTVQWGGNVRLHRSLSGILFPRSCLSDCCLAVASRVLIRAHSSAIRCSRALHKRNRVGPSGKTPAPSSGMRPSLMARALSRSAMVRPMWSGEWVGGRWVMVRPMWSGGWVRWRWEVRWVDDVMGVGGVPGGGGGVWFWGCCNSA